MVKHGSMNKRPLIDNLSKVPPQAIDLEEAILGALLLEKTAYLKVSHYFHEEGVFYKNAHQKILKSMQRLHEKGMVIDLYTVMEDLRSFKDLEAVGGPVYLTQLTSKVVSAANVEFHCMIVTDKYLHRELIRIGQEMQNRAFDDSIDAKDIAEWAENELMSKFDLDIEGRASFKDALHTTMLDIANKAKGIVNAFIRTGDLEVDEKISLRTRQMLLIAGAEGSGKTKYTISLTKGILDNNENVRILWFSMEDSKEQIIRAWISMGAKLTTKQMQSINYTLSEDDMLRIDKAVSEFKEYNIEFVDRVCSISTIQRKARTMREKYKDDIFIIIIDNLGLITTDSFYKGIEKDDYLAGKLKDICDMTESSIIVVHHITKEAAKKFNISEGYRPRKEYIKGSTRILDYVQQAILVNLPSKYKDLVSEEMQKAAMFNYVEKTGKFDKARFINELWNLNPHGDKNTKSLPDLLDATWNELKYTSTVEELPDGMKITIGYIIKKYIEYSIYIEDKNRDREPKFHTERMSIYSFLNGKKYKEDFKPKQTSRTFYLYGDDMSRAKYINELFILETVKNRDGSDAHDQNIIRYLTDLGHNIFNPISEKGWEELKTNSNTK
jgi:replicative DNA helicase